MSSPAEPSELKKLFDKHRILRLSFGDFERTLRIIDMAPPNPNVRCMMCKGKERKEAIADLGLCRAHARYFLYKHQRSR